MSKGRRLKWSRQIIISAIQERVSQGLRINAQAVEDSNPRLYGAGSRFFGAGWSGAVEAAGYEYENVRGCHRWTRKRIIEELQQGSADKIVFSFSDRKRLPIKIHAATIRLFGSFEAGVIAAGLRLEKRKFWTKELVIKEVRSRVKRGESINAKTILREVGGLYGARRLFAGSWESVVEAAGFNYRAVCMQMREKDLFRSHTGEDRVEYLKRVSRRKSRKR